MKMVRLRLDQCDELNFGDVRYVVSNSERHLGKNEVLVREDHAAHFLAHSCGATRVEEPEPAPITCPHCGRTFKGR